MGFPWTHRGRRKSPRDFPGFGSLQWPGRRAGCCGMVCPAPSGTAVNLPLEDAVIPRELGGREDGARLFLEAWSERHKADGRRDAPLHTKPLWYGGITLGMRARAVVGSPSLEMPRAHLEKVLSCLMYWEAGSALSRARARWCPRSLPASINR